jgi:hypothetical protein
MGEFALTLVIFIGVIAVTLLLFGGWLTVTIVRLISRGIGSAVNAAGALPRQASGPAVLCDYAQCRQANPPGARFCRRCGRPLPNRPSVAWKAA